MRTRSGTEWPICSEGACRIARSWRLELVQSKFKPGRKLTAYYRISPAHPSGSTTDPGDDLRDGHLAVTWFADRQPAMAVAPAPGGTRPPFVRSATASEDGRIVLRICPDDPAMPQLPRLTDTAAPRRPRR